jgi:ferredoxin-NADP reductase
VNSASLEVARALVDQRCGRCHSLDRVYTTAETPQEWSATVSRMVSYAAGSAGAIQPGEDQQIIAYLSATQTPEAVKRRLAQVAATATIGGSTVTQQVSAAAGHSTPTSGNDGKTIGFISLVGLGMLALVIRQPNRIVAANAKSDKTGGIVPSTGSSLSEPLVLRLASITAQTSDSKTLRFIVPNDRKINARPGQFLTFSFLFDGKKVVRSYSICSSSARSGYVEITTKRVNQGCVSLFLNDRASVGMTVEAHGPFGQFYFDDSKHHNVVLIAAGSGITPMMAMLRYIDDLCVQTTATLLYCVRTSDDIMFESEFEQLRSRQKLQYYVVLSEPHVEWSGPRGHINREFIADTVKDLKSSDFFLCGPPPFMEASRAILMGLGVEPERILQESFGSPAPKKAHAETVAQEEGMVLEFGRSGKACRVRSGQTLLEAVEAHGVGIPSSCRQGQCGTCKTRLLAGTVRMDTEEGLDPYWRAQGFVLTCVGHAEGPVKLDA